MAGDDTQSKQTGALVPGLTNPRALSLERFAIRTRVGDSTQSAWRLSIACDEGQGAIILVEVSASETFFRGDGLFLGWTQERMEKAYRALVPKEDGPAFEMHQLG